MIIKLHSGRHTSLIAECQNCEWWSGSRSGGRFAESHREKTGHRILFAPAIDAKYEGMSGEQIADAYRDEGRDDVG